MLKINKKESFSYLSINENLPFFNIRSQLKNQMSSQNQTIFNKIGLKMVNFKKGRKKKRNKFWLIGFRFIRGLKCENRVNWFGAWI